MAYGNPHPKKGAKMKRTGNRPRPARPEMKYGKAKRENYGKSKLADKLANKEL